ncbi:MAG: pilus assembly protein TadG-related protein [Nitrospinota bacterium]
MKPKARRFRCGVDEEKERVMGEATKSVRRRGRAGRAGVLLALLLPVLLGFAALTADVSYLYYARTALQATADAACLAGGAGPLESEAQATVRRTAIGKHNINQKTAALANSLLTVTFPSGTTIRATVSNPAMRLFFWRVIGWATAPVSATCGVSAANSVRGNGLIPRPSIALSRSARAAPGRST